MELVELHVLQWDAPSEGNRNAIAGEGVGVGGGLVDLSEAAGCKDDGLARENVNLAGCQLVGNHTRWLSLVHHQVQNIELVVKLDTELDAGLVKSLQNHVASPVGRVAASSNRSLAVVSGVTAKPTLVNFAVRGAIEGQAHVFQVNYRLHRLLGQDLGSILINEVVATFHSVEGVPLPAVLLDVRKGCCHSALGGSGVAACWEQLRDHSDTGLTAGFDRSAHASSAGTNDDDVVRVIGDVVGRAQKSSFLVRWAE